MGSAELLAYWGQERAKSCQDQRLGDVFGTIGCYMWMSCDTL